MNSAHSFGMCGDCCWRTNTPQWTSSSDAESSWQYKRELGVEPLTNPECFTQTQGGYGRMPPASSFVDQNASVSFYGS